MTIEGSELGLGKNGVEGPDPAFRIVPDGVVDGGDEEVDAPSAAHP